jgi:hypothetical protein
MARGTKIESFGESVYRQYVKKQKSILVYSPKGKGRRRMKSGWQKAYEGSR